MATATPTMTTAAVSPKAVQFHVEELDLFQELVQDLCDVLGPTSGLDSSEINPKQIEDLLLDYQSKTSEWQPYALADYTRPYTRNLVHAGNGKFNLVSLFILPCFSG